MLTRLVRSTTNDRRRPIPNLLLILTTFKKSIIFDFLRERSSAGEHTTEARGVRGSTPRAPIFDVRKINC